MLGFLESNPAVCIDCMLRFHLNLQITIPLTGEVDESKFPNLRPVCATCFEGAAGTRQAV